MAACVLVTMITNSSLERPGLRGCVLHDCTSNGPPVMLSSPHRPVALPMCTLPIRPIASKEGVDKLSTRAYIVK